jgi:SAM-dependent methyltransferase
VEVGPGTGHATIDLLAHGADVEAIEIGPAMAATLRSNLPSDRLHVRIGDFEDIDVAARSADAVFSASAYHWIGPRAQLDRPATILRPGGFMAIVDLIQVSSPADGGFFAAAQPIYERYGQPHSGPPAPARADAEPALRMALAGDPRFGDVTVRRYDWDQTYSAADYGKLMLSYSGTQMMDEDARMGLMGDIESFIEEPWWVRHPAPGRHADHRDAPPRDLARVRHSGGPRSLGKHTCQDPGRGLGTVHAP